VRRHARSRLSLLPLVAVALLVALAMLVASSAGCADEGGEPTVTSASPSPAEAVLAWVEGEPVTQADVELVLAEARLAGETVDPEAALDEAIGRVLVRREAERLGVAVDDAALEARLGEIRDRLGGEDALTARLQDAVMTREQLRLGAAYGLLRERLRDQKFAGESAADEAVRRFYDENRETLFTEPAAVKLGSILFRGENAAKGVAAKLRAGRPFDEMARRYSMDPESKANGGLLGWVEEASLPEPLAQAVRGLKRGELSEVTAGPGGWFILKLYDRRAAQTRSFAEVEDELRAELDRRERLQALEGWLERERERVQIERTGG
jgi:parvulin-like peptidyl-prolyl isomerase